MTQLSILAVNVFGEENKANETTPQQNTQTSVDKPEVKTQSSTKQEANTNTTQVASPQDALNASAPWIVGGFIIIVVLLSLLVIIRKLNRLKPSGKQGK